MNTQERPPAVVVGVDGTPGAKSALVWAAGAAHRRGVQLRITHGLTVPMVMGAYATAGRFAVADDIRTAGEELLAEGAEYAHGAYPDLDVATVLAPEDAPAVLLNEARNEDVIVVGSRGLGAVRAIMLGSVSARASSRARCPVVVVPEEHGAQRHWGRVVVGVDGSESSRRALGFGLHEALMSGSSVVVVNSWEVPLPVGAPSLAEDERSFHEEKFDRQSEEIVAGVLAEVIDDTTQHLDISAVRVQSEPVEALRTASEDADLVVVGSRGRGGVRGLVMGSVSQGVVHHSRAPVAVLPPRSEESQ